jgi:CubicO group peptidase (beta-lactamase class C family)
VFGFKKILAVAAALAFLSVGASGASAAAAAAGASEPQAVSAQVAADFDAALERATAAPSGGAPAISVAIVENDTLAYARAFGTSDVATKTAATTATRFRAGSITKMFTAVAVLQLVETGRLKIDEPLATYLPQAPHAGEVTLRQLLTHTSGIPNYADAAVASGATSNPTTPQGILATVAGKPLDFVPGRRYGYSNTDYVLLGLVVERATGRSLAAYEREHVLEPAGMTQTTFGRAPVDVPVATGYDDGIVASAATLDPSWLYAAGDVLTTASDLARFDIALMNGKLVLPSTLASMARSGVEPDADGRSYGLGLMIRPFGDDRLVGHHGGVPGFEANDEMLVGKGFAVVILGNSFRFDTAAVEDAMLAALLPSDYAAFGGAQRRRAAEVAAAADPKVTAMLRKLLAGLARGTVDRSTLSGPMNVAFTDDEIAALATQFAPLGPLTALVFRGKTIDGAYDVYEYAATFTTNSKAIPIRFVLNAAGKIEGFFQA